MKIKHLIKRLCDFNMDADISFEAKGHNPGGETEFFELGYIDIHEDGQGVTIRLEDN